MEKGGHVLVWSERHDEIEAAIRREKQLKKWNRAWNIRLIEAANPDWFDLAVSELGFPPLQLSESARDGPPRSRGRRGELPLAPPPPPH